MKILRFLLFFIALSPAVFAQTDPSFYGFPLNHLPWFTIETEHFTVSYQEGNQRTARVVATISEDVYAPITSLYKHEPNTKVAIVLKDREDYSNGAAYFFDNKIDIWVPALDTPLRGSHHWLRNVIAHEFTHIIQIQAAMKRKRNVPAVYVQWLSYEAVRRPDVLYGFPNGIATFPFASVNVPAWLAEGTAQYQRDGLHYETWDAHRDMILRQRVLDGTVMTLAEMGSFAGKNSLERETVYNHGYAFSIWLSNRFGEDILNAISRALAEKNVFDVAKAIKIATGMDGDSLHASWVKDLETHYAPFKSGQFSETTFVEDNGFFNFSPRVSKNGRYLAYVSNRDRDYSRQSLYVRDVKTGAFLKVKDLHAMEGTGSHSAFSCGFSADPVVNLMSGSFDFSPDSKKLVFSKTIQNPFGELYNDLFLFDLKSKKPKALTKSARLTDPVFHPEGKTIAALQVTDGTMNLVLVDVEKGSVSPVTKFSNGEQLYLPAWHPNGTELIAGFSRDGHRELVKINTSNGLVSSYRKDATVDFRDATVSADGKRVVFSASKNGVFNLYESTWNGTDDKPVTSVVGGAFQPAIEPDGGLVFAHFTPGGYKLSRLKTNAEAPALVDFQPVLKNGKGTSFASLNTFSDTMSVFLEHPKRVPGDTIRVPFQLNGATETHDAQLKRYTGEYTSLSVFPIVRFDNYSRLNGGNASLVKAGNIGKLGGNLWRDVKPGVYLASRDVRDRFTVFGGAMVGPGSYPVSDGLASSVRPNRLARLDRDLFLIFENQGLPFLKKSWNPTIALELYNLRRNVKNGLQIEDFSCTACLPDTIGVDIAYEVWQADLYLRSKINLYSMIELGVSHSPYTVKTDQFFSSEYKQVVPEGSSRYFIGTTLSAAYIFRFDVPSAVGDVVPVGMRGLARISRQPGRLLSSYEVRDGSLFPVYDEVKNTSFELQYRQGWAGTNRGFSFRSRVFSYLNSNNEYFYLDYIGGFTGMRSYPFFALGGNTTAFVEASGYVPLWARLNRQMGRFTVNSIWLRGYLEAGNGWGGPLNIGNNIKTGVGTELRVNMNSYYLFPSKFFLSTAYGFDRFDLQLPSGFVGTNGGRTTYGGEFLLYFGFLFDFDL